MNKKYNFQESISQNYNGKAAYPYLSAAINGGETLRNNWVTVHENVPHKLELQTVSMTPILDDATCEFADNTTLTLSDRTLEIKNLQFGMDLCKSALLASWEAESMGSRMNSRLGPKFQQFVLAEVAAKVAEAAENAIWTGSGGSNTFQGFIGSGGGLASGTTSVNLGNASFDGTAAAATIGHIVDRGFNYVMQKAAETKSAVLAQPDVAFYVGPKLAAFYKMRLADQGYANIYSTADVPLTYQGIPIYVCPGLDSTATGKKKIILTYKKNLHFGTNAMSDWSSIGLIDRTPIDGSDNVRIYGKFGSGTQVATPADAIVGTFA